MNNRQNADQVSGGVFLIGLALLFLTGFWWPGIMFVIGASMIAKTIVQGRPLNHATGAFWVIGIGLVFWLPGALNISFGNLWPLLLIVLGLFMLFGGQYRPKMDRYEDKPKHDDEEYV